MLLDSEKSYMDDYLITANSMENLESDIKKFIRIIRKSKWIINKLKTSVISQTTNYLGLTLRRRVKPVNITVCPGLRIYLE